MQFIFISLSALVAQLLELFSLCHDPLSQLPNGLCGQIEVLEIVDGWNGCLDIICALGAALSNIFIQSGFIDQESISIIGLWLGNRLFLDFAGKMFHLRGNAAGHGGRPLATIGEVIILDISW